MEGTKEKTKKKKQNKKTRGKKNEEFSYVKQGSFLVPNVKQKDANQWNQWERDTVEKYFVIVPHLTPLFLFSSFYK